MPDSQHQVACYHCGLPVPDSLNIDVEILGESRPMCCAGCKAVAEAIVENGLDDFYLHRTSNAPQGEELIPEALRELDLYDNEKLQASFVHQHDGAVREASLILEGITCAACIWLNERHVKSLDGVLDFHVNYSTHRAQLNWDNSRIHLSDVLKAITAIGYHAHPFDPSKQEELHKKERSKMIRRIGVAGVGMMQVMMLAVAMYLGANEGMDANIRKLLRWASLVITIPVILYSAKPFFVSAWRDLKRKKFGMDVPVSLAIAAAFLASAWATVRGSGEVYFDSVTMFTFFLLSGRFLEMSARHQAGRVADELVKLMPATAHRLGKNGIDVIPAIELVVGDQVLIKPGETIPADGKVREGISSVDESLLTGESLPLRRKPGDVVIGGSVNRESPLTVQVENIGSDTVLASISRLLERAHAEKPAIAELANRVAGWFVLALLIIAAAVYFYWLPSGAEKAFWITLSVLVITCPCALSLATPVAITAATGALTKLGVLTTRGHALETLAATTDIIFDKTGTLTQGELAVSSVQLLGDRSEKESLAIASALEAFSEHPIALAIQSKDTNLEATNVETVPGMGLEGTVADQRYRLGNSEYIQSWHPGTKSPQDNKKGTQILLADKNSVFASIELGDNLRPESTEMIRMLNSAGIDVHLLSGDNPGAVKAVADTLNIQHSKGSQLPGDKLAYVKQLQGQGKTVVMVGDGINDAPVLAAAQVSIAMGAGAQLAQASADMVLLSNDLNHLPQAINKARRTLTIIRQNIAWAITYNLVALPLAAMGFIAPWMAAIGMSFSSLLVVLNALRLREQRRS